MYLISDADHTSIKRRRRRRRPTAPPCASRPRTCVVDGMWRGTCISKQMRQWLRPAENEIGTQYSIAQTLIR